MQSIEPLKFFYDRTGEWWGSATISERDRQRAADLERFCGSGRKRILELGAGCGGTSAAMADRGHDVVSVELSSVRAAYAKKLANQSRQGSLIVLEADFYTVSLANQFDVVCYWSGFGIGSDADQRYLLHRMADEWLQPEGCILMDVFHPTWWARNAGKEEAKLPTLVQRIDFDSVQCRLIEQWFSTKNKKQELSQSIRCYSPVDFLLLVAVSGLKVNLFEAAGQPFYLPNMDTSNRDISKKGTCHNMSQNISHNVSQNISQDISQDISFSVSQNVSQDIPHGVSQDVLSNTWKYFVKLTLAS